MDTKYAFPKTLIETVTLYSNESFAHETIAKLRWPNGVKCPHCGAMGAKFLATYRRWECVNKHAKRQFTVKVGTVFEDSPISIGKWLMAIWMLTSDKNGISSYEIHRSIGVTQKSAWFMMHRIRLAFKQGSFDKMSGIVEADEAFIGGKVANFKKGKIAELRKEAKALKPGRPVNLSRVVKKAIVVGMLERGMNGNTSQVRTEMVEARRRPHITDIIKKNVELGATVMTDALRSYNRLADDGFIHMAINHAISYAKGAVHTNGLENFWALTQRMLVGTYVACEPFHLHRYLDEMAFRFNNRKMTDGERFKKAVGAVEGKRITYAELTGKVGEQPVMAPDAPTLGTGQTERLA